MILSWQHAVHVRILFQYKSSLTGRGLSMQYSQKTCFLKCLASNHTIKYEKRACTDYVIGFLFSKMIILFLWPIYDIAFEYYIYCSQHPSILAFCSKYKTFKTVNQIAWIWSLDKVVYWTWKYYHVKEIGVSRPHILVANVRINERSCLCIFQIYNCLFGCSLVSTVTSQIKVIKGLEIWSLLILFRSAIKPLPKRWVRLDVRDVQVRCLVRSDWERSI